MDNKTLIHIDTYDIMQNDYRIDPSKIVESIISYDRLVFQIGNPKITINKIVNLLSTDILEEYINNKIITFCQTNKEYNLSTGGLGNFIVPNPFIYHTENLDKTSYRDEAILEEYLWKAIDDIDISQNRKKNLNKAILDNLFIIPSDRINEKLCLQTVLEEINDIQLVKRIIEKNKIYFNKKYLIEELIYTVTLTDKGFHFKINKEDFDEKNTIYTILYIVLAILIYTNIFMNSSNILSSTGVWVDRSTSDVIENKFSRILTHYDKSNEVFKYLMTKERVPDIGELYKRGKINFRDIDKIRLKSENLRKLIGNLNPSDNIEIYNQYLDFVQSNISPNETIPIKLLRFLIFSVTGSYLGGNLGNAIGGIVVNLIGSSLPSAFDSFLLPHLHYRPIQYIRFSDIKKDL
nr:hypothetical protein [uncultured Lachnoclostridium sp.]